jgi:predicted DNA repair protein MutK
MDDVAVMSNCSQKTAGILGDDLAVNAEKPFDFLARTSRIMGHCKGSNQYKVIILPIAFFVERILPVAVIIILVLGTI